MMDHTQGQFSSASGEEAVEERFEERYSISFLIRKLDQDMTPCCVECLGRRVEMFYDIGNRHPTLNPIYEDIKRHFDYYEEAVLKRAIETYEEPQLSRHQFYYWADVDAYRHVFPDRIDTEDRFALGPAPQPTPAVPEYTQRRVVYIQLGGPSQASRRIIMGDYDQQWLVDQPVNATGPANQGASGTTKRNRRRRNRRRNQGHNRGNQEHGNDDSVWDTHGVEVQRRAVQTGQVAQANIQPQLAQEPTVKAESDTNTSVFLGSHPSPRQPVVKTESTFTFFPPVPQQPSRIGDNTNVSSFFPSSSHGTHQPRIRTENDANTSSFTFSPWLPQQPTNTENDASASTFFRSLYRDT